MKKRIYCQQCLRPLELRNIPGRGPVYAHRNGESKHCAERSKYIHEELTEMRKPKKPTARRSK